MKKTFSKIFCYLHEKPPRPYQQTRAGVLTSLLDGGVISPEEARKALSSDADSGFSGIDPDDVPEQRDGEDGGPGDMDGMSELEGVPGMGPAPEPEEKPDAPEEANRGTIAVDGAPRGNRNAAGPHRKNGAVNAGNTAGGKIRGVNDLSPSGVNTFTARGFANKQKLKNHWQNGRTHREEYPEFKTAEEYEAAALKLLETPCGGDIAGHLDKDGNVIRYNRKTNDFAKGHPDRGVISMFKPIFGEKYYLNMLKGDLEHGGRK